MIVQSGPAEGPRFVMTMDQHTAFAAALAEQFGNDEFEPPVPRELFLYLVANHDAGWRELDRRAPRNPATGFPYHLVETPMADIVATSSASPDFNEQHHAYCGMLSSMHSWGLYNGRYGMSDKVLIEGLQGQDRELAARMLEGEEQRQSRLRAELDEQQGATSGTRPEEIFRSYKLLQFFDTLALYFNCTPEGARAATSFSHVPRNLAEDTEVAVEPLGDGAYRLVPWPFDVDEVSLSYSGCELLPESAGEELGWLLRDTEETHQSVVLRRTAD